jgi:hypothetical protein
MQGYIAALIEIVLTPVKLARVLVAHWWDHRNDGKPKKIDRW